MANLIVGADGTAVDPSDRESVINAAEAVPGIEDSDINDGWLIEHTENLDAGPGMMKYRIVLPDGSPLECTPFQIDRRRDMAKVWMATVRAEILGRANAAAEVTRAAALKARRDKQMQGAGIQVAGQMPTPEEAAQLWAAVKAPPPPPPEHSRPLVEAARAAIREEPVPTPRVASDPLEYAQAQLEQLESELAHWQSLQAKAAKNAKTAQKAVLKWKTVLEALSESDPAPAVEQSDDTASSSRAGKLARTLQTSAAATRK